MNGPQQTLVLTSFPPRVCGIATYTQDLLAGLRRTYGGSAQFKVCALTQGLWDAELPEHVTCTLNTMDEASYKAVALRVNTDDRITRVWVQHEFGLYPGAEGRWLINMLRAIDKPLSITLHTVLPYPSTHQEETICTLAALAQHLLVLTKRSATLLQDRYRIPARKIHVLHHGAHPVPFADAQHVKEMLNVKGRKVLTTFGLLSSNKSIETAIDALPVIVKEVPEVIYLVLGRTHPEVVRREGEKYRESLMARVNDLGLQAHVRFVDRYLELHEILDHLRATDVYLFTSKDPEQAVSGTFTYALGCGCPVISTRIPHAEEMLEGAGILVDFNSPGQMAQAAILLLKDDAKREQMGLVALQRMQAWGWDNMAIAHMNVFSRGATGSRVPTLRHPPISLAHIRRLTSDHGIHQFAKLSSPDPAAGHTLDDNARALIAISNWIMLTGRTSALDLVNIYMDFLERAIQPDGAFLNYFDTTGRPTQQNFRENLNDANGRAVWALGEVTANKGIPAPYRERARQLLLKAMPHFRNIRSHRAEAFIIKGLYSFSQACEDEGPQVEIELIAARLAEGMAAHFKSEWKWIEPTITYGSAVIPEAFLLAWDSTGDPAYQEAARSTMHFLIEHFFKDGYFHGVSNRGWLRPGVEPYPYGEQPIEAAYMVLALDRFHQILGHDYYRQRRDTAFQWFLGNNHLRQTIYDRSTGGCHDGLEEENVNLNEGAESTVCYLLARVAVEPSPIPIRLLKRPGHRSTGWRRNTDRSIPRSNMPMVITAQNLPHSSTQM